MTPEEAQSLKVGDRIWAPQNPPYQRTVIQAGPKTVKLANHPDARYGDIHARTKLRSYHITEVEAVEAWVDRCIDNVAFYRQSLTNAEAALEAARLRRADYP